MSLTIYNHLTRQKEKFQSLHKGFVGLYVCGPTVYGHAHAGHGKVYITYDVMHRYFEYLGYKVRYVQNITDVGHLVGDGDEGDDKINKQAQIERIEPMEIVEYYTHSYFEDMDRLNILRPDISPRASGHVPEQIELADMLLEKGFAYEKNGSVFFSVGKWPTYGKLSGRNIDDLETGSRIAINPDKIDPRDFCIWRSAKPGQIMTWNSPWGRGIPGWHAECSVMSKKYLGLPFDIHGGGLENIFPHNESEIAQCEAAYGTQMANYWVLNNMITVNGTKMGKSLGNFITLKALFENHHPMVIRFYILSNHYRSVTDFSEDNLAASAKAYQRLMDTLGEVRKRLDQDNISNTSDTHGFEVILESHKRVFLDAMDDDLNTPKAISAIFNLNKVVNTLLKENHFSGKNILSAIDHTYEMFLNNILGLDTGEHLPASNDTDMTSELITLMLDVRETMRYKKNWEMADLIRDKLEKLGFFIKDHPDEGTTWYKR